MLNCPAQMSYQAAGRQPVSEQVELLPGPADDDGSYVIKMFHVFMATLSRHLLDCSPSLSRKM